jgi:hypothetical protein
LKGVLDDWGVCPGVRSFRGVCRPSQRTKRKLKVCDKRRWNDSNRVCGGLANGQTRAGVLSEFRKEVLYLLSAAWVEQLQKHQEREAAAYANATGGQPGESAQEGEQGAENQAQGQSARRQSAQGARLLQWAPCPVGIPRVITPFSFSPFFFSNLPIFIYSFTIQHHEFN